VQAVMKVNSPRMAIAGRAAGSPTVRKVRNVLAPSTRAASRSSSGMTSTRYWRMKNTPNAVTRVGMMTAPKEPVQPNSFMSMNSGMMANWVGMARVAMTKTIKSSWPRKRSFAKAYPARVENITTEVVITPETIREFPSAFQNGTVLKTSATLAQNWLPGSNGGNRSVSADLSELPMTTDQYSG